MVTFRIALLLGLLSLFTTVRGQDVHFSMYNFSPLLLNPGETGHHKGDWRVATNYRQQWKAIGKPIQTAAASFDQKVYALPGNFSIGGLILFDQSGVIDLVHNRAFLSLGYALHREQWTLSIGLQGGYVLKNYNLSGTTFPEQYNPNVGLFDPNLPLSEMGLSNQTGYFDANAGLIAERRFETSLFTLGFSVLHLNRPNVSFFNDADILPGRYTFHGRWRKDYNKQYFIQPSAMLSLHAKAQSLMLGGQVGMMFDGSNPVREIFLGVDMRNGIERNGDAFILSGGFNYGNFIIGMAYDVNYSTLRSATNNRGAFEINLIYLSPSSAVNRIAIPCDRY